MSLLTPKTYGPTDHAHTLTRHYPYRVTRKSSLPTRGRQAALLLLVVHSRTLRTLLIPVV